MRKILLLYVFVVMAGICRVSSQSLTTYEYDELNRLVQVSYPNGQRVQFEYDVLGNRTSMTVTQDTYLVTATVAPEAAGTVEGAGNYAPNTQATLVATANEGYSFANWTENGETVSTAATYTFTVNGARNLVANFTQAIYTVTATASPENGGTITGAGTYVHGDTVTLAANANEGYTFVNWTENDEVVSAEPTCSFVVTAAHTLVAHFSLNSYAVSVEASPEEGGTVTGEGVFNYGATATLTATANTGYTFYNWTMNGQQVSTNTTYTFTVSAGATYVAHFSLNTYLITAIANPMAGGTVSGSGNYAHGSTVTLNAVPNDDYEFVNWTQDGEEVSTEPTYSFTVMEAGNYVANFVEGFVVQTTNFAQGWNWWSTYVEQDGIDGLTMLEQSLGSNGYQIKSQTDFVTNYGVMWMGLLTGINNEETYMLNNTADCQIELTGTPVSSTDHPITISNGWNWIGYPCTNTMSLAEAFAGYTPANGDQVKSQSDYAMYFSGMWIGQLLSITPGTGLMYMSNNATSTTLVYPNGGRDTEATTPAKATHWTNDIHAYPNNMTVMAVVELDGVELTSDNYELATFDINGECRGSARLTYVEPLNRHFAFLTIAGDETVELHFGLYDSRTGEECYESNDALAYTTDALVGSFNEPLVVRFGSSFGSDEWSNSLKVYPNPVGRGQRFSIGTDDIGARPVCVEIVNAFGMTVSVETSTSLPVHITAPNTAGVYMLRVFVEGQGASMRKLVIK